MTVVSDHGLWLRMAAALGLVVLLPFAFVYVLLFLLNTVGIVFLEELTSRPWNGRFYVNPLLLAGVIALGLAFQFAFGDRVALRSVDARPTSETLNPELHASVTRLASQLDVPPPDVAISSSEVPNAFTVGRTPRSATVVVTEGLLERLDAEERDAVLAHELAHVANNDVSVMTVAYFLPTLTYFVAIGAYLFLSGIVRAIGRSVHVDGDDARGAILLVAILVISSLITLAVSLAFWIGSFLLFRLLARYREHAADRGAAVATGRPLALASALRELDAGMADLPDEDLRERDGGLEALYVAPIETEQFGSERALISRDLFPETHPPTEERVERLEEIASEMETR